jgi:8-oxo-dGTP diphosphatase
MLLLMDEFWDLYDSTGKNVSQPIKRGEPIPEGLYHRIIHVWIQNEKGEFLIQQRAKHLSWFGGRWATTTGSIQMNQFDFLSEAYREIGEELSLSYSDIDLEFEKELIIGNSIISLYKAFLPQYKIKSIVLNDEVADVKWMSASKIVHLIDNDEFAPYSDELFNIVFAIKF